MDAPNPPLTPDVRIGGQPSAQQELALASDGVQRLLWQGLFGVMLIEVRDGVAFVNGDRVASVRELQAAPIDGPSQTFR